MAQPPDRWQELIALACSDVIESTIPHPQLDRSDAELALNWVNNPTIRLSVRGDNFETAFLQDRFAKDYALGQMFSARAAEKAALLFYQQHGFQVHDESIQQLTAPNSSQWQVYDLLINSQPFDVKNVRRSERSPNTYVEHCVPQFKEDRNHQNVAIIGVLSQYLWPQHVVRPEVAPKDTDILVLGSVRRAHLDALQAEFERPGLFQINLSDGARPWGAFLPAWSFDYPDSLYSNRSRAISDIREMRAQGFLAVGEPEANPRPERKLLPLLLASDLDIESAWGTTPIAPWASALVSSVHHWIGSAGLSLPFLFYSLLVADRQSIAYSRMSARTDRASFT